jgi:hypothetical protein
MIEFLKNTWYYYAALYIFFLYVLVAGWICLRMHARSLVDERGVNDEM